MRLLPCFQSLSLVAENGLTLLESKRQTLQNTGYQLKVNKPKSSFDDFTIGELPREKRLRQAAFLNFFSVH
jgi:hypothetical protein